MPHDDRTLLLLGLLVAQDRHGYELHDFIQHNLQHVLPLKKATAYQLLDRLEQLGLVGSRPELYGERTPRKVYSLTGAGRAHFETLLLQLLGDEEPLFPPGNVPVMFSDHLPDAALVPALRARLAKLDARLALYAGFTFPFPKGVRRAIERLQVLTQADRSWVARTLEQLEQPDDAQSDP
ncbi:transcriptional regulator, PadR-like family [Deinococcus maricopensis DSM 21211]|uniref:Transcriptional regulator, PadR-like family n=1 Tax=Deinococcus maricopensis (strain DSM 21211 / LMG 22137 / NRRL B-23946 / LB-34) TaxID=709986 RepID=E8U344_DEIML|nr:transcriptional regulator, PadR-like family [Deinococcus maricopensis DSM 21211]